MNKLLKVIIIILVILIVITFIKESGGSGESGESGESGMPTRYSMFQFTGINISTMQSINGVCQDDELIFLNLPDDNIVVCLGYPSGVITFRHDNTHLKSN